MTDTKAALEEAQNRYEAAQRREHSARDVYESAVNMRKALEETYARARQAHTAAVAPPVDRSNIELTTGDPVPEDLSHTKIGPDGMQEGYIVLTESERKKGFVRPYRESYLHSRCGQVTTMGPALSETYARDPFFYSGTFCATCREHFPIGEDGEFVWLEMDGRKTDKVGT